MPIDDELFSTVLKANSKYSSLCIHICETFVFNDTRQTGCRIGGGEYIECNDHALVNQPPFSGCNLFVQFLIKMLFVYFSRNIIGSGSGK